MALGVWVAPFREQPAAPEEQPTGRAALLLEREGCPVIVGSHARDGVLIGHRATPGAWVAAAGRVDAIYDRFPSRSRPESYAALERESLDIPRGNPASLIDLCTDKLRCQRALAVRQPEVEGDPARFSDALARWGAAFLKPRFGAFGVGVRRVSPGDTLPAWTDGPHGDRQPTLLQQAVSPPAGFAGVACRVLVQRDEAGWWADVPVARTSRTDAVVNAARGAEVVPLAAAWPAAVDDVRQLALAVAAQLAALPGGRWLIELGVDIVLDEVGGPWVIEVNGRPRGRLESLLPQDPLWLPAHVDACARPLRALAALSRTRPL